MLAGLHVKNLAIIDETEVNFGEGLNILTGETGAGKSVVLGSIEFCLGARSGRTMIRTGAEYAFVELRFTAERPELAERLKAIDVYPDEGMVVIQRRMTKDRSVSRINGETANLQKVREAASLLLDIHGQQQNVSLLRQKNHLEIVDQYAHTETAPIRAELTGLVKNCRAKEKELADSSRDESERLRELDFLRYEVGEIEGAGLVKGEEEELEALYRRMSNAYRIADDISEADGFLSGDGGASEQVSRAVRVLGHLAELDPAAKDLESQIADIESLISDLTASLADYREENTFDEQSFRETEERLDLIRGIMAKHGGTYDRTIAYLAEAKTKIEQLENYAEYRDRLTAEVENLRKKIRGRSMTLRRIRQKAAAVLEKEIASALEDLNFLQVGFAISFEALEDFTEKGMDEVAFMISTNPGEPLRPLTGVASGGELSRIMLAIKSVMAGIDDTDTLIFDEIDTGISGRTAQMVSEKMAALSRSRQLIAVTHLGQIAAMADHHFLIEKAAEEGRTRTGIRELDAEGEIRELARIAGGAEITESVLQTAREMKAMADAAKKALAEEKA